MIVIERPDLLISIALKPDPPEPAQYIEIYVEDRSAYDAYWIRLTAAEADTLADALRIAAMRGRLVE
jgi:hypothetical protein